MISAKDSDGNVEVSFSVREGYSGEALKERFFQELKDEKIREKSSSENIHATEYILSKALKCSEDVNEEEDENTEEDSSALTPEQEQELDALIAEVERELSAEMGNLKKEEDPQKITKTWEEMNQDGK
jgi:predicted component of type VI protein secretion system